MCVGEWVGGWKQWIAFANQKSWQWQNSKKRFL
jgi:hypothetical protein